MVTGQVSVCKRIEGRNLVILSEGEGEGGLTEGRWLNLLRCDF